MELEKLKKDELLTLAAEQGILEDLSAKTKAEIVAILKTPVAEEETPVEPQVKEAKEERYEPKATVMLGSQVLAVFTKSQFGDEEYDATPEIAHGEAGKIVGPKYRALAIKKAQMLNVEVIFE